MRTWLPTFAIMVVALLISTSADATTTGNDLYNYCSEYVAKKATYNSGFCTGYIASATETLVGLEVICPSAQVTYQQGYDVVVQFLEIHPEYRDRSATILILAALKTAFPCSKPD